MEPQHLGQYRHIAKQGTRKVGNVAFRIACYGAYRAGGLIGPENNGIVVLNESAHRVVLDQHARQETGWYDNFGGPTPKLVQEFDRLLGLSDEAFLAFIRGHEKFRGDVALLSVEPEQVEAVLRERVGEEFWSLFEKLCEQKKASIHVFEGDHGPEAIGIELQLDGTEGPEVEALNQKFAKQAADVLLKRVLQLAMQAGRPGAEMN